MDCSCHLRSHAKVSSSFLGLIKQTFVILCLLLDIPVRICDVQCKRLMFELVMVLGFLPLSNFRKFTTCVLINICNLEDWLFMFYLIEFCFVILKCHIIYVMASMFWHLQVHSNGLLDPPKVLSDIVESLIGAIYFDSNFDQEEVWRVCFSLN
jgi:hypothetical protein